MSDIEELIALTYQPITSEGKAKIFKFIQKYHAEDLELRMMFGANCDLSEFSEEKELFVHFLWKNSPHKDVQGAALYRLADGYLKAANFSAKLDLLNIGVDEFLALNFPGVKGSQMSHLKDLRRWEGKDWSLLREQGIGFLEILLKDYRDVRLYMLGLGKDKVEELPVGRIGKNAKSKLLASKKMAVGVDLNEIPVNDLSGMIIDMGDYLGKVKIIYIWSSECGPCLTSLPYYQELADAMRSQGKPIELITLNVDKDYCQFNSFLSKNKMPFENYYIGRNNRILHEWDVVGYPTAILINKANMVYDFGQISKDFLVFFIEKMINRDS